MPGFVDVHSHVVPAGDDGAATIEEGLELCRLAYEAGTEILFATPHAHAPWDHYPRTDGTRPPLRRVARGDAQRGRRLGARPPARLGGVPERDRRERSRRPRARRHPRGPDRVPGLVARHRGSDRRRSSTRPSWSRRRGSCPCSPTRSVAAPSPTIPRASARSPSGAGSCASMRRRSSAGTALPRSAPRGRCSTPGSSASPPPTATRSRGRRPSTPRTTWCASAVATRSRCRCSTAARFPGA